MLERALGLDVGSGHDDVGEIPKLSLGRRFELVLTVTRKDEDAQATGLARGRQFGQGLRLSHRFAARKGYAFESIDRSNLREQFGYRAILAASRIPCVAVPAARAMNRAALHPDHEAFAGPISRATRNRPGQP